jgi:hypothetical protein
MSRNGAPMTTILHILQHALGRDAYGRQTKNGGEDYRNHFVAGHDDVQVCRAAVALGLMIEHPSSPITGRDPWFSVSEVGKAYIAEHSPRPPKLTRGQRRYREWLNRADLYGGTFGDWLKQHHGKRAEMKQGMTDE